MKKIIPPHPNLLPQGEKELDQYSLCMGDHELDLHRALRTGFVISHKADSRDDRIFAAIERQLARQLCLIEFTSSPSTGEDRGEGAI